MTFLLFVVLDGGGGPGERAVEDGLDSKFKSFGPGGRPQYPGRKAVFRHLPSSC